ncbi:MAG: hypothetical protein JO364_17565 [Pseudonocardiales bacterium]|nr:hypothetical protein [Pseudonocardiales bacterium]MBV9032071.1 hypothetical protein [Pseudonocardiales bacterium]
MPVWHAEVDRQRFIAKWGICYPEGDHPSGVLKARCGDVMTNAQYDQLPPSLKCER